MNTIYPKRLEVGDTVGIISPSGATFDSELFDIATESLTNLGFKVVFGKNARNHYGYLAGTDAERLEDLHTFFEDKAIKGIIAMRGGFGATRILDKIDFELITRNPKVLIGFSDITALLVSIYNHTGLVTFHSNTASSAWNSYTVDYFKKVIMNAESVYFENPTDKGDNLAQVNNRIRTIKSGKTEGTLIGGNLSVLATLVGSKHLKHWHGKILFLEEINEEIYRVDRLLSQLALAGIFEQVAGIIFGKFTNCEAGNNRFGSLTLEQVFQDYTHHLSIPIYSGAMIGHIPLKFTIPVGAKVQMDADKGTITMLNPAVL
jgi:muramoyltetrapeptide carboxypeptidase